MNRNIYRYLPMDIYSQNSYGIDTMKEGGVSTTNSYGIDTKNIYE